MADPELLPAASCLRYLRQDPAKIIPTDRDSMKLLAFFTNEKRSPVLANIVGRVIGWGAWVGIVGLGWWFIRRDAFKYLEWSQDIYLRFWPNRGLLATHVVAAGIALVLGPLQFSGKVRRRWPRVHRWSGWAYVVGALISAPVALRLSFSSCPACVPPFAMWSATSLVVTVFAVWAAVSRDFAAHRAFMIRSYVLMNGFVFLRLDHHLIGTPLELPLPGGEGVARAPMLLWVIWVAPLLVTELYLSWWPAVTKASRRQARRAAEG